MSERIEGSNPSLPIDKYNRYAIIQVVHKKLLTFLGDTEMKRLIVMMVVLMGVWSSTALAGPWTRSVFGGGCHLNLRSGCGGSIIYPSPWTRSVLGGGCYIGDSYYGDLGHANENVNLKYNERWDVQGGERSYEQSPNLPGKVIDGALDIGKIWALRGIFAH